ncbi:MAG: ABC transporter permease subunit [Chitinophagaceae bacterium]
MWTIIRKEWGQFFSGWMGYVSIAVFLLVTSIILYFVPEESLLEAGYASLDPFFELSPLLLLILVPAVTMRIFSDEYKMGTFELLKSLPVRNSSLVLGKYFSALFIVFVAILSSLVYVFLLYHLSLNGIDAGSVIGSYIGLIFLAGVYTSLGVYISSLMNNSLAAFMLTAFACFLLYNVFSYFPSLYLGSQNIGYFISLIGVKYHYENMSKGFIALSDLIYFVSIISLFIYQTSIHLSKRKN